MGIDYFGCLNSLLCFYFSTNPRKKINDIRTLTAQPLALLQYEPVRFQLDHPSPSKRTYFMADPTLHRTLRAHGMRGKNRVISINMVLDYC